MRENLRHPVSVLLLQLIVIMATARAAGGLIRRFGQPAVVGEIVAGILLGPSCLGLFAPRLQSYLFPEASLGVLQALSQIGVVLFLFVVGAEIDLPSLRRQAHRTILVSHVSIVVPFFLGAALALLLYGRLAPPGIPFAGFALFIGAAMSITAFPVLARIIAERGLAGTPLGSTSIACAAVDDVTAWCLLAVVVAAVRASGLAGAMRTILLAILFAGALLAVVRPRLARLAPAPAPPAAPVSGGRERTAVVAALAFAFGCALVTQAIGIHALFGAFLAGVVVSARPALRPILQERLDTVGAVVLLPLFFAFAGLRTQVGLIDDASSWLACALIVVTAIAGKLGAGALAARWTGLSWPEALSLGALMNARGLMELVVLNIGYDLGILSPRMFSMMVLMALVTTLMTGPLLTALARSRALP